MKKINQGKYELFTTKQDAIDKFMKMQGICREEISGEGAIEFYCFKNGKIFISHPRTRHIENDNSTNLYAKVVEQDGKTYVLYHTEYSKSSSVSKLIFLVIDILVAILAIAITVSSKQKMYYLPLLVLSILLFSIKFFNATREEKNSPADSEILIKELEKRVEAVNLWDK